MIPGIMEVMDAVVVVGSRNVPRGTVYVTADLAEDPTWQGVAQAGGNLHVIAGRRTVIMSVQAYERFVEANAAMELPGVGGN